MDGTSKEAKSLDEQSMTKISKCILRKGGISSSKTSVYPFEIKNDNVRDFGEM